MLHRIVGLLFTALVGISLSVSSAAGAIDLTGVYLMSLPIQYCLVSLTQSGTDLSMSGTCDIVGNLSAVGTVDPDTGAFTLTGQGQVFCTSPGALTFDAVGNGTTFSGTATCDDVTYSVYGSTCGNGIDDTGEDCDDGNQQDGDCCSSTCQFEPPGSICWEYDAPECTLSGEGACVAGTCTHPPAASGTSCSADATSCTDDVCDGAGSCVHPPVAAGTQCENDGNPCTDDLCNAGGTCVHAMNTGPCDDGNSCTNGDMCSGGTCVSGTPAAPGAPCFDGDLCFSGDTCDASATCIPGEDPVTCDACSDACLPEYGCVALSIAECSGVPVEPSSLLTIQSRELDDKDKMAWSWGKGEATMTSDFGDPVASTNYRFCAYAMRAAIAVPFSVEVVYQTLAVAEMPAGAGWTALKKGFKYKGATTQAVLKSGEQGKARITVKGKGGSLGVPASLADYSVDAYSDYFGQVHAPAVVQLHGEDGHCWGAQFDSFDKQRSDFIRAKHGR